MVVGGPRVGSIPSAPARLRPSETKRGFNELLLNVPGPSMESFGFLFYLFILLFILFLKCSFPLFPMPSQSQLHCPARATT